MTFIDEKTVTEKGRILKINILKKVKEIKHNIQKLFLTLNIFCLDRAVY